ncbi:DNA-protecting protein DprA [Glaciecola sp. MH2013]|uniref:DNA-processing protein DprA n=1 Tax=Glaciecola sp. MH2013 TaxID=2785524 RepID=UPI00189CBB49|nr:DNA-processing protein DprA [Glaciecola sp. MH2013]MBF7074677.1 DNA-protecting protein DprA [Glaciecola sp. MH2013]
MITSNADINYWLALTAIPKIGIAGLLSTARHFKTNIAALGDISGSSLQAYGWTDEQIACLSEQNPFTQKAYNWLHDIDTSSLSETSDAQGRFIISYDCLEYPPLLREISQPPILLFADGNINLLAEQQLAVVGTRHPSAGGINAINTIVAELVRTSNIVITSGLALGIDAQCHQTCLSNSGKTIGVLGCGIDRIYPQRHKSLYAKVQRSGLLLSEFPPSVLPSPKHFPRRNRIISGMSCGTLVAEAKIKSGSLVTAKYASEQNREVFAMPSHIHNSQAKGCHWLIKQGAKLAECAQDILDELPINQKQSLAMAPLLDTVSTDLKESVDAMISEAADPILQAIDYDLTSIDDIAKRSGECIPNLLTKLLEYELRGIVASTSGGYLKLRA